MSNRRRKGKKHRPVPVIVNMLDFLAPAPIADRRTVMLRLRFALDAMARQQHPGEHDWSALADVINTVETLAETMACLDSDEVMPSVDLAIKGMAEAAKRHRAGLGMRLSGEGLKAVGDCIAIYEQALEGLNGSQMDEARRRTVERIRQYRTRGTVPGREVVEV